jgi:hypothetical protein
VLEQGDLNFTCATPSAARTLGRKSPYEGQVSPVLSPHSISESIIVEEMTTSPAFEIEDRTGLAGFKCFDCQWQSGLVRADVIFAGASARFGHPEQSIGIITLLGGVYRIAERAGRLCAIEWALTSLTFYPSLSLLNFLE